MGRPEFETVPGAYKMALMWRMNKPMWVTGNTVITDSGFCVLKFLISMYDRGVYGSSVVMKRRCWLSGIYGDQINAGFFFN